MDNIERIVVIHSPNSTRAKKFNRVNDELRFIAEPRSIKILDIVLDDLPYYQALKLIYKTIQDGDLIIAAGGDGVAQVTFNAVYLSSKDAIYTTIPLGNGNDISRAINGKLRATSSILSQNITEFYPLNIVANGKVILSLISYVTFGATTVLVDYLNDDNSRRLRRKLKDLSPAAAVPVSKLNKISKQINELNFPDFNRGETLMTDDSIGFFVISAAHNVLRLPKDVLLASSEFFFHHSTTKDKKLVGKVVMAGAWAIKFPGEMTELEELEFKDNTTDIIANVSGDNVNLGPITRLTAIRSSRSVKILCNKTRA